MTKLESAKLTAALALFFPAARFSEENADAYEALLRDLDASLAMSAVARLAATSKFFPTVAEIRAEALALTDGGARNAEEAWGDVVEAIRHVGAYREPTFKDASVAFAVARLGWRNLCLEGRNDASDRARFCELYSRAVERERRDRQASPGLAAGPRGHLSDAVRGLLGGIGGKP
jgi:hypothetical protein